MAGKAGEQEGLDDLAGLVAQADIELTPEIFDPGAPAGPMVPAGPDYNTEAAMAVDMFAGMVCGFAPKAASIWDDAAKQRTAGALAPVLEKYGVSLGSIPPELVLGIVAGPLLWQSARAVSAQVDEQQRAALVARNGQEAPASQPAPEAGFVQPPAVHPQMALYQNGAQQA